jgi:Mn2+/Fe2+ NRAMP family transporter
MRYYPAFRNTAIRYWERRRIFYNLALIPPSLFAYMVMAGLAYVGDPHETHYGYVLFWFALSALGANICYSFAYALEFLFGSDDPTSRWLRFGRTTAFVGGVVFAMLLAFVGGRNIALMEFYEQAKRVG